MASPKRNANRRKFNRQPLDVDDLTSASSFSGIREVVESHFSSSDNPDQSVEAGGAEGPRNVEPDPEHPQYVWEPKGVPFSVRLDAGLIERLEKQSLDIFRAITNRGSEIGGILLGQVLPGWPVSIVVSDYEPVECAYTLGPSYLLSEEEQEKLADAIEKNQKPGGLGVVGFFRSNTRPALVLQDDDQDLFEEFFPEDHNIFLLAKPYSRKPCQGAIYVREGGKIRTDVSALEFAFSRPELEKLGALQPGLRLSSQPAPARVGPASTADRIAAIPIDSALAEPKRPEPPPITPKPEPVPAPPPPVEAKPAPREIRIEPRVEQKTEPQADVPKAAPPAQQPAQQRIEARLPWLKPVSATPPAARPVAPPAESTAPGTVARPVRPPLFTPPARVETRTTQPEPPPAARPAEPSPASVAPSTPAPTARPPFTPPTRVEARTTQPEPPPAARPAAPPPASAAPSTPAPTVRPPFTPPTRVEARTTPTEPPPAARPAAPSPVSAAPRAPAPPMRPLFTPPPRVETRPTPPAPTVSAPPSAPATPARTLFTPAPRVEARTTPAEPPPAPRPAAPPPESAAPSAPAPTTRPLFTPPASVETQATPPSGPPSPPRFSTRIQSKIPPSVQPRIATNLGAKPGSGPAQPTRFMPRIGQQPVPQQPKPEPKPDATVAPKVEPPAPAKPPARTEPVVVVRPPAQPRTEVKVEPQVEPEAQRFTRIQPAAPAKPEPAPQPAAPPAADRDSEVRRKPAQSDVPNFGYKKPEPAEETASDGKRRWILPVVIALVIVIVGVYFVIIRPNRKTAEEAAPAAAAQAAEHRQPIELSLRVEGSDSGLNIFWDGLAAPISTAPRGVLSIRDGASTKNFDLTSEELKKGTYVYKPRTDDVLIRLDLKGLPGNQVANGGTRVFGARRLGKTGK